MATLLVEPPASSARSRFGRTISAPKRYVPIETPVDDFTDDDDELESDVEAEGNTVVLRFRKKKRRSADVAGSGGSQPLKRRMLDSESDSDSEDDSDTGSDLEGFIVSDGDGDDDYLECSDEEEPEELFDSDGDSE